MMPVVNHDVKICRGVPLIIVDGKANVDNWQSEHQLIKIIIPIQLLPLASLLLKIAVPHVFILRLHYVLTASRRPFFVYLFCFCFCFCFVTEICFRVCIQGKYTMIKSPDSGPTENKFVWATSDFIMFIMSSPSIWVWKKGGQSGLLHFPLHPTNNTHHPHKDEQKMKPIFKLQCSKNNLN